MSADNGIFVAEFSDGWRVAEDGLPYDRSSTAMREFFKASPVYATRVEALVAAHDLALITVTEYGVMELGKF